MRIKNLIKVLLIFTIIVITSLGCRDQLSKKDNAVEDTGAFKKIVDSTLKNKSFDIDGIWGLYKVISFPATDKIDSSIHINIKGNTLIKRKKGVEQLSSPFIIADSNKAWINFQLTKYSETNLQYNRKYDYLILNNDGFDGVSEYFQRN